MFVGGFILAFSLLALIGGSVMGYKTLRVRRWPATTGQMLEKEVVYSDKPVASNRATRYEVKLRYRYKVADKAYVSTNYRPTVEITRKHEAQKVIDSLGDEVTVYYNPSNPAEAYLSTNSLAWSILAFIVGVFCTLIGVAKLVSGIQSGS